MNVQPIDLGDELRHGLQFRLALAPVVIGRPVAGELPHRRERHALRLICDRLPVGPAGGQHALPEVDECCFRNVDAEGSDGAGGDLRLRHGGLPLCRSLGVAGRSEQDEAERTCGCPGGQNAAPRAAGGAVAASRDVGGGGVQDSFERHCGLLPETTLLMIVWRLKFATIPLQLMSRALEHRQRRFDAIVRHE